MATRIVVNRRGVASLLREPRVVVDLTRRAHAIAAAAGEGHRVDVQVGRTRARAAVITDTIEAAIREGRDRTLTRALDAGR